MINEQIHQFQNKMNEHFRMFQPLCFMTRAIELQSEAIDVLEELLTELKNIKQDCVTSQYENEANVCLAFENIIHVLVNELRMWIALKEDDPHDAWKHLIDAHTCAVNSIRAHPVAEHMGKYIDRLETLEQLVFPPQIFNSPGMIINSAECSICRKEYGACEHVKGRPYMGELCGRIIKDFVITEESIVDDPADKRCIVKSFSRDGVTWVDRMTLREFVHTEPEASSS